MSDKSKQLAEDELIKEIITALWQNVDYWDNQPSITTREKMSGAIFSSLVFLDGLSGSSRCAFDLVARTNKEDTDFLKDEGSEWVEDGQGAGCA